MDEELADQVEQAKQEAMGDDEYEGAVEGSAQLPNSYIYAAIPFGVPEAIKKEYWGFVTKQLALANHQHSDEESIMNRLRIVDLTVKSGKTRNELRVFNKKNNTSYSNLRVFVQAVVSLGRSGLLIKEIGKSRKNISISTEGTGNEHVGMREQIKNKVGGFF